MMLALFQSHGIVLLTNGIRWILWVIFWVILPKGITLATWASKWWAHDTLYSWLFASTVGQKGMNHSTYARCSGGWLFTGNKRHHAAKLMLKTAWSCATQWAVGHQWWAGSKGMNSPQIPVSPSFPLWTSTVSKRCKWWNVADMGHVHHRGLVVSSWSRGQAWRMRGRPMLAIGDEGNERETRWGRNGTEWVRWVIFNA